MRVLLATNLPYFPGHGGSLRSNRAILERLALLGHEVFVVAPALPTPSAQAIDDVVGAIEAAGLRPIRLADTWSFAWHGVHVRAVVEGTRVRQALGQTVRELQPDCVLVSSEDPAQNLLAAALASQAPVVYLAHTPAMFPFGPASFFPGEARSRLVRQCAAVVAISRAVASYLEHWGGITAAVWHPPHYDAPPPAPVADPNGEILMVNPCAVKGVSLFTALASAHPDRAFAAVPGWGTTTRDVADLEALPNVRWRAPADGPDRWLNGTRLLLVPSLWFEGFGMVVVEAMLRGVPVLAADHAGLVEAALGAARLLPVRPIERYGAELDERHLPVPHLSRQETGPWSEAIADLCDDVRVWQAASQAGREAANAFVAGLTMAPFVEILEGVRRAPRHHVPVVASSVSRSSAPASNASASLRSLTAALTPAQKDALRARLRARGRAESVPSSAAAAPLVPAPREGHASPLSYAQERLWFIEQLEPGTSTYNCPVLVRIRGSLSIPALRRALNQLVTRHEILRTRFPRTGGEPVQCVTPAAALPVAVVDLSSMPERVRRDESARLARIEARQPFDLEAGPVLRTRLIRLAPDDAVLLITLHHIATDAWSMTIFIRDVTALYAAIVEGRPSAPAPLAVQYADFAIWQRSSSSRARIERDVDFWTRTLAGVPTVCRLVNGSAAGADLRSRGTRWRADAVLARTLAPFARAHAATPFMVLLTAFEIVLWHVTRQERFIVGTDAAGRSHPHTEDLIGFFVNQLPLCADVREHETFRDLLDRVRVHVRDALTHDHAPFHAIVEAVRPERAATRTPLVQVKLVLQNAPVQRIAVPGAEIEAEVIDGDLARFDLLFNLEVRGDELAGALEWRAGLLDEHWIDDFLDAYGAVLSDAINEPAVALATLRERLIRRSAARHSDRQRVRAGERLDRLRQTARRGITLPTR